MGFEWSVSAGEAGQRLGTFIRDRFEGQYSARQIKRWIEGNRCEVNGVVERFASRSLLKGDRVVLRAPESDMKLQLSAPLFEDSALVIVNKPPGITSEQLAKRLGHVELVHRLDKDTSGVLVLAKTSAAKRRMEELFRERAVSKTYLALVEGCPKQNEGHIVSYLAKVHAYEGQTLYGSVPKGQGLLAETYWKCMRRGKDAALIACFPKTGRTHQLRVHLKELGNPILGDYQYARAQRTALRPTRQLLHAWKIAFAHPLDGTPLELVAPLPQDFQDAVKALKDRL